MRYGLSALGLPDAVGRGIEMSGNAQEQITDAILPDEVEQAMSDLKRWFVDKVMEEAFGFTLTELERYLHDPGTYLTSRTLFPEGTKAKIDTELGNFAQAFSALECTRINFVPFQNTLNMIKLQLVDPEELVRVLWTERALPRNLSTEEHIRAFVQTFFKSGIQMQFMRSLDAGYDWDRPDFAGCMLWDDPTVRQKIFHRIFQVARPGRGRGPGGVGGRTEIRGLLPGIAIPAEVRLAVGRRRRRHTVRAERPRLPLLPPRGRFPERARRRHGRESASGSCPK